MHETLQHGRHPLLPCLGIHSRQRVGRVRDAEQVEEERKRVGQRRVEPHDGAGDLPARGLVIVVGRYPDDAAQELEHGQERDRRAVRDRARRVHGDASCAGTLDELVAESALADSRLADHADDPPVAVERAPKRHI